MITKRLPLVIALVVIATAAASAGAAFFPRSTPRSSSTAFRAQPVGLKLNAAESPGAQPTAFARTKRASDNLPPGLPVGAAMNLNGASRRVATWSGAHGGQVFLAKSSDGRTCILLSRSDETGAVGCNASNNPFAGKPFFWTSGTLGGPSPDEMSAYEVVGVVRPDVSSVELVDSAGRVHPLDINADGAFLYNVPGADLQDAVVPVTLRAYRSNGSLIAAEDVS
jgi:hypothetical protein